MSGISSRSIRTPGSKSAQTPIESRQDSRGGGASAECEVKGKIESLIQTGKTNIKVYHKWRGIALYHQVHHSQIFVKDSNDKDLLNFGLWSDDNGNVVFVPDDSESARWYKISNTYSPNPVILPSGVMLMTAFLNTVAKCGPNYAQLDNNCQKFGRLFMTELGASHKRSLFHP
ncbi:MAG: hypothetical protein ACYCQM_07880 [Acidithiobacillus sp.]